MSLQKIKVSREEVLKIVKENKEKHDGILKDAIVGYWLDAETFIKKYEKEQVENINKVHKQQLKNLRKQYKESLKNLKANTKHDLDLIKDKNHEQCFRFWSGNYPEDHGDDYIGTIRRLELCVDDVIELDVNEFDSYIRNKWTWRDQFISSTKYYITSCYTNTGSYDGISGSYAISSSWASGSYATF